MLVADFLFDLSHFLRKEFHRRAALRAHHMMMIASVVLMFVTRYAVVKSHFAGQSTAGKKLQRPVDRGNANARIALLNQSVQFVNRKVFASLKKSSEDRIALFRLFQTHAAEMSKENSLRLADALPRDIQMIVNSLLQHVGWQKKPVAITRPSVANMILG
jgi:hypothetical protein